MLHLLLTLLLWYQAEPDTRWSKEKPFVFPETTAIAFQDKKDVTIRITYTDETPKDVCVGIYELADVEWSSPTSVICVDNIHPVGDIVIFKGERIDMANFMAVIRYPSGKTDLRYMIWKLNT